MPKVYVDASIFTKAKAFGKISGQIDVSIIPQIGDLMTFGPRGPTSVFTVVGLLRVNDRIISANDGVAVSLVLEDIIVETDEDARKLIQFFEAGHGLLGDVWDDQD